MLSIYAETTPRPEVHCFEEKERYFIILGFVICKICSILRLDARNQEYQHVTWIHNVGRYESG
jgi:hypothetical protein